MITLKTEPRQRLFYRQYRYAIDLRYCGFEYMNRLDPEYVATRYRLRGEHSWQGLNLQPDLTLLLEIALQLKEFETQCTDTKVVNSWYSRFYYTNSDTAIGKLQHIPEIEIVQYREAVTSLPDGVLLRKNNPYCYRTYFRERKIDPKQGFEFLESVCKYGDYFRLNQSTKHRLVSERHRYPFCRNSYIEHNSIGDRLILEMLLPGFLGRTLPIQAK
jgi:hypothetical protein